MNIDNLRTQWQEQVNESSNDQLATGESMKNSQTENLISQFISVDKRAKERTLYGSITFLVMIMSLSALSYFMHLLNAPTVIIAAFSSWIAIIVVNAIRLWKVQKVKQTQVPEHAAVMNHLTAKLAVVKQEIDFYMSLWKWVTFPMGIGFCMLVMSLKDSASYFELLYIVIYFVLSIYGHRYCKRLVASELSPLKSTIDTALANSALAEER